MMMLEKPCLHVVDQAQRPKQNTILVCTEKAFDQVSWKFARTIEI